MILFLFYSLFTIVHGVAPPDSAAKLCDVDYPDPPFKLCDTPDFAVNSSYRACLDGLLSLLSYAIPPLSKSYYTSVRTHSDRVYVLFLCYRYSTENQCQTCLHTILQDMRKRCMYKSDATVWHEYCLFRYSSRDFYAFDPSSDMHSNGAIPFTEDSSLYAFVQCFNHLSPSDCNTCLETGIKEVLDRCNSSRGARLLSRSCFRRYERYAFYEGEGEVEGNVSQTNQNSMPKAGTHIEKWMIAVIASGAGILALSALGCCVFYVVPRNQSRSNRVNKWHYSFSTYDFAIPTLRKISLTVISGKSKTSGDQETQVQHRDNLDFLDYGSGMQNNLNPEEFPFIEMKMIEEATNNFSGILPDGQEIAVRGSQATLSKVQTNSSMKFKKTCTTKLDLVDPMLKESCPLQEVGRCINIGLLCVQEDPAERPTMSQVVVLLESRLTALPQPNKPAFSVGRVVRQSPPAVTHFWVQRCSIDFQEILVQVEPDSVI
ncbi:UNVERIFIED_CONTAM: Cysteine-rich receptor-like protein kinase [Sesamum latifolium]|uniref:Cysteine-rich receptor-like protein kinase n=1 Tax=Sesamum latifolium TaxID=2727402 RepID=A0AAW2WPH6_9LAMI